MNTNGAFLTCVVNLTCVCFNLASPLTEVSPILCAGNAGNSTEAWTSSNRYHGQLPSTAECGAALQYMNGLLLGSQHRMKGEPT